MALALLAEVKNDIISERVSMARADYLRVALAIALAIIGLMGLFATGALDWIRRFDDEMKPVWTAMSGGTVGAFFSIAIGLKGRTVLINLQNRDNIADAILRILIGAIAGGLIVCLLGSNLVSNTVKTEQLQWGNARYSDKLVFVLAFLAGFFERLVPDLLAMTSLGTKEGTKGVMGTAANALQAPPPPPPPPPGPSPSHGAGARRRN
jgi:hypothetical protein